MPEDDSDLKKEVLDRLERSDLRQFSKQANTELEGVWDNLEIVKSISRDIDYIWMTIDRRANVENQKELIDPSWINLWKQTLQAVTRLVIANGRDPADEIHDVVLYLEKLTDSSRMHQPKSIRLEQFFKNAAHAFRQLGLNLADYIPDL